MSNLKSLKPFFMPTPADFIKEQLDARDWTQEDFADVLGYSIQTIHKLLKKNTPITIDVANALAKAFNQTPQYWLNLDNIYRLRLRNNTENDEAVAIRSKLFELFPINEMAKRLWIDKKDLINSVMRFFNAKSIEDILESKISGLVFRKSETFEERFNPNAASCWFQMAKNVSSNIEVAPYNAAKLKLLSQNLYQYTSKPNGVTEFLSELNDCGVRFFVLSHLPKTYIDGAAFLINSVPTIVFTARHKRLDNFWFTMAHEIGHILLHLNSKMWYIIDSDSQEMNQMESEANQEAAKMLRHEEIFNALGRKDYLSSPSITEAANQIGVHPCIIIGALSHEKTSYHKRLQEFNEDIMGLIPDIYHVEKRS